MADISANLTQNGSVPEIIPLREAVPTWARIAALSFGGPAGQIAVMHRILVEEKRWIGEERFLHALNYCMLLPGPEAHQLAVYIGWLMHGVRAAIPQASPLASAEFATIRERLIKIGARVIEHLARIRIQLPTSCPEGPLFRSVALGLMPSGP